VECHLATRGTEDTEGTKAIWDLGKAIYVSTVSISSVPFVIFVPLVVKGAIVQWPVNSN